MTKRFLLSALGCLGLASLVACSGGAGGDVVSGGGGAPSNGGVAGDATPGTSSGPGVPGPGGSTSDAGTAPAPACDASAPFTHVASANGVDAPTRGATLSRDELEVFYVDATTRALMRATRPSRDAAFGAAAPVKEIAGMLDAGVGLSRDGKTLYFAQTVKKGAMNMPYGTIFRARRASPGSAFGAPEATGVEYSAGNALYPVPTASEDAMYYTRIVGATPHVMRVALPSASPTAATLAPADQPMAWGAAVSDDEAALYVGRLLPMLGGGPDEKSSDVFAGTRAAIGAPAPVDAATTVNIDGSPEIPVWLSVDRCRLYFTRDGVLHVAERALP